MSVLTNVVFFIANIHLVSGQFKVDPDVLGIDANMLPPEDLASLGQMKAIDPDELRPLKAFRDRIEAVLRQYGTSTPIGWAVPLATSQKCYVELQALQSSFMALADKLVGRCDDLVRDWATAHPQYKDHIMKRGYTGEHLRRQIRFEIETLKASSVTTNPKDVLNRTTEKTEGSMLSFVLTDIADEASTTLTAIGQRAEKGNLSIARQTMSKYRNALIPKLRSFAFLDERVRILADRMIDMVRRYDNAVSASVEGKGQATGKDYETIITDLQFFSSVAQMQAIATSGATAPVVAQVHTIPVPGEAPRQTLRPSQAVPAAPSLPVKQSPASRGFGIRVVGTA